ncbi:MAG: mRNA interferase MazF [Patescibacteria group bacterium]|nr:mRNA interferase MazF [Patescibacteria group bacterium]
MNDESYNKWNKVKKKVNRNSTPDFFFKEREIWWCSLGMNIGVETNGKNDLFERPVLILRIFNREMIWIVPVTSSLKKSKFYYSITISGLRQSINITQLRIVSSKRFLRKVCQLSNDDFDAIKNNLIMILKNETPTHGGGISEPEGNNTLSLSK